MAMVKQRRVAQALSIAVATATFWWAADEARGQASIAALQQDLQLAVCLQDWDTAINLTGMLIAAPEISDQQRSELVTFRAQFQAALRRDVPIGIPAQCEERLARYAEPLPVVDAPLNWDSAFYSAYGVGRFSPNPDQRDRQQAAAKQAGLTEVVATDIEALSPARLIQTPTGVGVSAGAVSTGVNVFSFLGGAGDRISLELVVTDVLPGRLYTDDDSQIFLFDSEGTLFAENDDLSRLQSQLSDIPLPRPGVYYIAVTTYNNDPILDAANRITGWNNNGGSSIEYTITIDGLTPADELARPFVVVPD